MGTNHVARALCLRTLSRKRDDVGRKPFVEQGEAELAFSKGLYHKLESSLSPDIQITSIHQQKRMSRRKSHSLVAVHKRMIIDQRLEQRGRLFAQVIVVTRLGTENSCFQRALM